MPPAKLDATVPMRMSQSLVAVTPTPTQRFEDGFTLKMVVSHVMLRELLLGSEIAVHPVVSLMALCSAALVMLVPLLVKGA